MAKMFTKRKEQKAGKETPLVVGMWMLGMGSLSYLVARVGFYSSPHPYHWISAAVGTVVGYLVGWLWFRWKGDIV